MDTRRANGAVDPPYTSNDIVVSKVVRLTTNVPASGPRNVTIAQVLAALNVPTTGVQFRFVKMSVWSQQFESNSVEGSDSETLSVTIPAFGIAGAIPGGDGATIADNGTFGKRRPQVHIEPPTLVQQAWITPGAVGQPDLLASINITGDPTAGTAVIVHVSCEIRMLSSSA